MTTRDSQVQIYILESIDIVYQWVAFHPCISKSRRRDCNWEPTLPHFDSCSNIIIQALQQWTTNCPRFLPTGPAHLTIQSLTIPFENAFTRTVSRHPQAIHHSSRATTTQMRITIRGIARRRGFEDRGISKNASWSWNHRSRWSTIH